MDLSKYSSEELRQLRSDIDAELKSRRREDAKMAQKELKSVAEKYGFSLNELVSGAPAKQGRRSGTVRFRHPDAVVPSADVEWEPVGFRHPEDPSKVWSGRGRKPVWIKEWEGNGRSLEKLRVA